jgi:hypothetical protein
MTHRIAFPPGVEVEVSHPRINELAQLLAERLGADDYRRAEQLILAAIFPAVSRRLHDAAATTEGVSL